jgi:hypothetical protein
MAGQAAGGHEIPSVRRILGHSTPAIAAIIYAHAFPGRGREASRDCGFTGAVPEWPIGPFLKWERAVLPSSVGSNPTPSASAR